MRLPPMNALRAFEAAARHEGFVGAAEELHVTRGAISRQIKLLEEHIGTLLFRRHGKGVELTEAGRRLQPVLSKAFGEILDETARIGSEASDLRIICPPATSIRWLLPRLDRFRALHPEIRVRLTTDFVGPYGFDSHQYDVGFSLTHWPDRPDNLMVKTLFPVEVTPACAPALLEAQGRPERPEDLSRFLLLHETPRHADWRAWLEAFEVPGVDPESGSTFPNLDMAAKAATIGAGVVMADLALNRDELEAGLLVKLFPDMVCTSPMGGVCLIAMRDRWDDPKVTAFREWAVDETA